MVHYFSIKHHWTHYKKIISIACKLTYRATNNFNRARHLSEYRRNFFTQIALEWHYFFRDIIMGVF